MGWKPTTGGTSEFINVVRDHSATGDGTTDDTTAIQAAIDAAETIVSGGASGETVTVYFPAGTYITQLLTVNQSGIRLLLDPNATLKLKAGTYSIGSTSEGVISVHGTAMNRLERVFVEGGTIDGNKANVSLSSGTNVDFECLSFSYVDDCHVVGVRAINAKGDGFDFDQSNDCSITRCWAEDCGGWGYHASSASRRLRFIDCEAVNCGDDHSRGGFDQYVGASGNVADCTYIRCRAVDCYQNFDINGTGAHIGAIRSEGTTTVADDFSGVSVSLDDSLDLSEYPSSSGQLAGKVAQTDGANGWTFIDTPEGAYYEVIVSGSAPPVAVTNEAEDDWVYGEVTT